MAHTNAHGIRRLPRRIAILAALVLGNITAHAQTFEYSYGSNMCVENGKRGVAPVTLCAGGGYIAVGSSNAGGGLACGTSDVYVVRTNNNGGAIWEFTYDIGGAGGNDVGTSVIELSDGTGFVVTGWADLGGAATDIFLLKINCNGGVVWSQTYGGPANEYGEDIIEAVSFTAGNPYDLVVAGSTWSTTPVTSDAYLLRTDATGLMLWDASYHEAEHEWFNALTEATPTLTPGGGIQVVGDIIAVGGRKATAAIAPPIGIYQGYVVRVDGTNGAILPVAPLLQNAADYGGPAATDEWFNGVVELQSPGEFPNVVIVGKTTNVVAASELYLVKTNGDPCTQLAQSLIGDGVVAVDWEEAYDVQEVANNLPIALAGDLALTGYTTNGGVNNASDAFLLTVVPGGGAPLTPIAGSGNLYGDLAGNNDDGFSLHEVVANPLIGVTAGFVIAGTTASDFQVVGDPLDMYLIKTRGNGTTGALTAPCNGTWNPGSANPGWAPNCTTPVIGAIRAQAVVNTASAFRFWPFQRCFTVTATRKEGNGNDGGAVSAAPDITTPGIAATDAIRSYPNPVKRGTSITIEFMPSTSADLKVTVIDPAGRTVRSTTIKNQGSSLRIPVETEGLSAGAYLVMIDDGENAATLRMIVVD